MKKFICFIVLLIVLTGCSNNEKLTGNQAPDFELSVLHSGQEINKPTPLDKKELIIEHIYWNEEHAATTNDDILNLLLNLENSNIQTTPYHVVLDQFLINFDFSKAENKPNYFICLMENAKEEGFYWEGAIPENGVFNFSPPQTGTGVTKAEVILQWKRDESTVLGEQSIRFKLNVADK